MPQTKGLANQGAESTSAILLSDDEMAVALANCSPEAVAGIHERRTSNRWAFRAIQPIAPYGQWGFPKVEMFKAVQCHDLSTGGVSYLTRAQPQFEFAVIGLGTPEKLQFFVVRIAYCRKYKPGSDEYLVGCEFVERIRRPPGH